MSIHITSGSTPVNAPERDERERASSAQVNIPLTSVNTAHQNFEDKTSHDVKSPSPDEGADLAASALTYHSSVHDALLSASAPPAPPAPPPTLTGMSRHSDLDRATITKSMALHVAQALTASTDSDQALRGEMMLSCANHLRDTSGELNAMTPCRQRACPWCLQAKQRQVFARFTSSLGYLDRMADEAPAAIPRSRTMKAIKFTLNSGSTCGVDELPERLATLHKLFPRAMRITAVADSVIGYLRSSEITESLPATEPARCNPHLHGVILVRGDIDPAEVVKAIKAYWPRALKRMYAKRGRLDIATSSSADYMEPFEEHTSKALIGWAKYILKGASWHYVGKAESRDAFLSSSPDYWQGVERALFKQRLVATGGELRVAMSQAETDYQARRLREDTAQPKPIATTGAVMRDDFIWINSISGYARRRLIEQAAEQRMRLSAFMRCSDVSGSPTADEEAWKVEVTAIARELSPLSAYILSMIALNTARSGLNKPPMRFVGKKEQERRRAHWSEPKERLMRSAPRGPAQSPKRATPATPPSSAPSDGNKGH